MICSKCSLRSILQIMWALFAGLLANPRETCFELFNIGRKHGDLVFMQSEFLYIFQGPCFRKFCTLSTEFSTAEVLPSFYNSKKIVNIGIFSGNILPETGRFRAKYLQESPFMASFSGRNPQFQYIERRPAGRPKMLYLPSSAWVEGDLPQPAAPQLIQQHDPRA